MATLHQKISVSGYCPIDKSTTPISIGYHSFPQTGETTKNMTFTKSKNNYCSYLTSGKCKLQPWECPIWIGALDTIKLDISNKQ